MADYATGTGSLGASLWLVVTSTENVGGNYSSVHAELQIRSVNSATNVGTPGRGCSIYLNGTWYAASFTWASGGGSRTIQAIDVNIGHDANGYLSFPVAGRIEATGTSGIGGATQIPTGTFDTPRIPKRPGAPGTPSLASPVPMQINASWAAPADGGSPITNYRVYTSVNADMSAGSFIDTGSASPAGTVTGLLPGRVWYVAVYAQNAYGFSDRSGVASIRVGIGGRRWDGTDELPFTTAVRWNGSAEVPITTAVRWDGTAEVPLT